MKTLSIFAIIFFILFSIVLSDDAYGSLSLDKGSYSWADKVKIRLMVHGFDHKQDTIQISVGNNELKSYKLSKAGNGLYTGEVILTGFLHDVDGDGKPDTAPRTTGSGPNNGFLESMRDEKLEIIVKLNDGTKIKTTTKIAWNVGEISFDASSHQFDATAKLQAIDPDMNLNPKTLDKLPIHVFSDSDKAGILVDAIETQEESGIFETTVIFTQNSDSSGNRLYAMSGDVIYAQYTDHTLPEPYRINDDLDIVAESRVHDSLIPEPEQEESIKFIDFSYTYTLGKPIQFILEKPRDANCNSYTAKITDDKGNFVLGWGADISCDPTVVSNPIQTKIGYSESKPIIINESGKYHLEVEFIDAFIKQEFTVRENHGGGSIDRTVYPVPFGIPSPHKQMDLGIKLGHIICDEDKVPVWNTHYKPSCVYPDTESELISRGWAKLRLMLPASPYPEKEMEWMGRNVMSMMLEGTFSYSSTPVGTLDEKKNAVEEYSKQYHFGEQYLEYAITPYQYHYNVGDKVQFDLLEWGYFPDCPNFTLRIIDMDDHPVFEHISKNLCVDSDDTSVTVNSYSMGDYFEEFVCNDSGYYRIEVSNGDIFPPTILQNFACLDSEPKSMGITPEPQPKPVSELNPEIQMKLDDAKKLLETAYYENVNLGPLKINDVILGFGVDNDTMIIDVKYRYSTSSEMDIVKKKIRDIVGDEIKIEYIPSKSSRIIETVMTYHWNAYLQQNNIEFVPANTSYGNNDDGIGDGNILCSPLVAPNGTDFFIASTINVEPFLITDTFLDQEKPQFCKKTWKTDVLLVEPDRITSLWLALGQGKIPRD
ncbi:hypothetical protein [Nitrosopumilus sp.]|uniref:hypothetical protein n=1 Tax=Nitrosopumilus sp. TaxID=2024843 RepID=UPI0026187BD4|nr:hypothetical protein [Nitrosopumilus sp.]